MPSGDMEKKKGEKEKKKRINKLKKDTLKKFLFIFKSLSSHHNMKNKFSKRFCFFFFFFF